jgi:hypothetical protein
MPRRTIANTAPELLAEHRALAAGSPTDNRSRAAT